MKYSIIIVSYKAEDYLRKCLKSIKESKIEDAEIIVVDNSPAPIFGENKPPADCRLSFNAYFTGENLGFAEGCNVGAKISTGEILVFVNPDTEVYDNWHEMLLDRLVDGCVAVGPMASGYVSGYQKAQLYGVSTLGREAFDECREKFKGQTLEGVKVLIGFFLMIPRVIFEEVGGMDKGCFLGSDDLDLSLRLRDKYGEKALSVAKDVCIMHDGNKSFQSRPTKEVNELVEQSENHVREKLYLKYGGKPPTSTELWGAPFWNTERPRPMTLSVCMIVRDEEENLLELLPQLSFVDQVVLVDTDPKSAKGITGLDCYFFPWTDNFSEARNFALSKCTGDYVLWLDADDRIPEMSGKLIRAAMDIPGWKMWNRRAAIEFIVHNTSAEGKESSFHQMRLFPNVPGVKWMGRVHENPLNSLDDLGVEVIACDIEIEHTGYATLELLQRKNERNLKLLNMEADSPAKHFNIGNSLMSVNDFEGAEKAFKAVLNTKWEQALNSSFIDHCRYMTALAYFHKGKIEEAGEYLEGNKKPDCVHLLGEYHLKKGDKDAAFIAFREYLRMSKTLIFDPWISFRPKLRKHAFSQVFAIINDVLGETVESADAEYPGIVAKELKGE